MKRIIYPRFEKCSPFNLAKQTNKDYYELEIDLANAFHRGYKDRHGRDPSGNKNPFLNEYEDLITDDRELRFLHPGIANDAESKTGESAKVGRSLALGIATEHMGMTWFASIQNLRKKIFGWMECNKKKLR